MTILLTNNFLLCELVLKIVTIVTNNFWPLKLVTNEVFFCSVCSSTILGNNSSFSLRKICGHKFQVYHLKLV